MEVKTWQVKKTHKEIVEARKKNIQERFRKEMGLLFDIPKPGFGTTNDGNCARRFFANPTLSSDITGVNEELIKRFSVILRTLSCGYQVNSEAFESYSLDTAKLFVKEYSWYYMPQSIHKVLLHGGQIIKSSLVPIGELSEEAQEALNKSSKFFRLWNTRKFSRKRTMEDMLNMLLVSSDPVISSLRKKTQKKSGPIPNEVLCLLQDPTSEI